MPMDPFARRWRRPGARGGRAAKPPAAQFVDRWVRRARTACGGKLLMESKKKKKKKKKKKQKKKKKKKEQEKKKQ